MYQFDIACHSGCYEIEGVDVRHGISMSIFQTSNKRLATLLCKSLSHAHPSQVVDVVKGWTGETDRHELERLNGILNNGKLFYRPLTDDVIAETELYADYKSANVKELWSAWINRKINDGKLAKKIPLLEC